MSNSQNSDKKALVIGHPVSHSLSPRLHGYWLKQYDINGKYEARDVPPENLKNTILSLVDEGYSGANITIPHKEKIIDIIDKIDPVARRIGAVNTLVIESDGKILGKNTDAYGFIENLRANIGDIEPYLKKAGIIGSGGATRAVCVALLDAGAEEILITNRTREKAEKIKNDLQQETVIRVCDWEEREKVIAGATLLVNTTSLGMQAMPELELSLEALPQQALVTDIVYHPLKTSLLLQAERRGNTIIDGLGMLLCQAQPAFEAWFGLRPEVTEALRQYIVRGTKQ